MKTYGGVEVSGQLHSSAAFSPRRKSPRYPFGARLDGPQPRSGRDGEEEKSLPLPDIESLSAGQQAQET